jgi:hypothetical protein
MPPYKAVVSKAQSRKLFALAERGEITMSEARSKTRAAKGEKLPEHVRAKQSERSGRPHAHEHTSGNRYGAMLRRR